ncbi:MAG: hypothetical protein JSW61_11930 [Candidatus Thorarchaeota archaeon]|nr:MAG: hypothetical protein JSW61_11930 [Candidatus Thorarchaeota archaeon]
MSKNSESGESSLPFVHGIEAELQVIRRDGTWIRGEEILVIFDSIMSKAKELIDHRIRSSTVDSVKRKYKYSTQTEEGERGSRIVASYEGPDGVFREYTLVGHDPNVTSLTWILEVASPPCTTLEELAWWVQTLIAVSHESIPEESRAILVSTGLNPTQEYLKNLSFGEHHHILGPDIDDGTRLAVYNMIRNHIPHLIALSVNSPFENKKPTNNVSVDDEGRTIAPRCLRSIRLHRNTTQMGPTSEFEFIPHLEEPDKEGFARHVNRSFARMVDVYPFTDYGTIEVRVFDTQLSVPRRIGIALLLQALALKAKRMHESGKRVPDVGAKSLSVNRMAALTAGLWAPFRPTSSEADSDYLDIYNSSIDDNGSFDIQRRNRFMADAVVSMLFLVRDELEELNAIDNPFMQALLVSLFGSEIVEPKTTGADYQLDVFAKSNLNMMTLLRKLADIARECCTNWLYDPLGGTPRLPQWICWWKGLEHEIVLQNERVFAGQSTEFVIRLDNQTGREVRDLTLSYSVEDSERRPISQDSFLLPLLEEDSTQEHTIGFKTEKLATAYNIIADVSFAGKRLVFSRTINTYWISANVRPASITQFADGDAPVLFTGEIDTNYPGGTQITCTVEVVAQDKETTYAASSREISVDEIAALAIRNDDFRPLIIPAGLSDGLERCLLRISIKDEMGNEVASSASRPFYVGFGRREMHLLLRTDIKGQHAPGEIIHGEIGLKGIGRRLQKTSRLLVEFSNEAGIHVPIVDIPAQELVGESLRFEWRVPSMSRDSPGENLGIVRAVLYDNGTEVAAAESPRFAILQMGVRMTIDSLRAPAQARIGDSISGWLRVRRNTELGEPASLLLILEFPDGETHELSNQPVKPSRNLSISFGPYTIPEVSSLNAERVTLVAAMFYAGIRLDTASTEIELTERAESEIAQIVFSGAPTFVTPDESVSSALHVTNTSGETLTGKLEVQLDSESGAISILSQDVDIKDEETRMFALQFRVPLSVEMSTAHLKARLTCGKRNLERVHRLKVKAISDAVFRAEFVLKDESGEEILGLVPRKTPIWIHISIHSVREGNEGLEIMLRVMTRRKPVEEFSLVWRKESASFDEKVRWITPDLEVVTGHYLELVISESGRPLPARAIEVQDKRFTIY